MLFRGDAQFKKPPRRKIRSSWRFIPRAGFATLRREMPHDIIDNRESYLADAVRPLLNQSVRGHFAVGYFFLSGFKAIAKELEKVQELRLLIGNTSDRATVE